jgi:ketosteroid isomerase-like protein
MSDKDTLFKYYGYFAEAKWDGLKNECFHPDITWVMPGHHPMSGTMRGADTVITFLKELYGAGISVDNVHVGELDNGWIVEKHLGHGEAEGIKYEFPTCTTYEFKDGKIYNVQVHNGDPIAADRFFWGRFKLKGVPDRLAK